MDALVVVESVFGNTRAVAEAIAAGLADRMTVRVVDVADAPTAVTGLDLLVVGGPTHAFGMSWSATRRSAGCSGPPGPWPPRPPTSPWPRSATRSWSGPG